MVVVVEWIKVLQFSYALISKEEDEDEEDEEESSKSVYGLKLFRCVFLWYTIFVGYYFSLNSNLHLHLHLNLCYCSNIHELQFVWFIIQTESIEAIFG